MRFNHLPLLGLVFSFLFSCCGYADNNNYYDQHAVGWHWYDDPKAETKEKARDNQNPPDPVAQMTAVKHALQRALDLAILNPTQENLVHYIKLQNAASTRAQIFTNQWQLALLNNPTLNYSISHPTNQIGREVYIDQKNQQEDAAIHLLAQHSGLFFFYRSTCPYCQRFAPIVKDFSQRYGIPVIPITTNGIALPAFPNSRIDHGQAAAFNVSVEPALFTVNPYTHKAVPVSYGLVSEEDLKERILDIATKTQGNS